MARIRIDTEEVISLSNRFHKSVDNLNNVIRTIDNDLNDLDWEGNQRDKLIRWWKKEKKNIKRLAEKSEDLGRTSRKKSELFVQVDEECSASLSKIRPAIEKLYDSLVTREVLDRQIAEIEDRLRIARAERNKKQKLAQKLIDEKIEAWKEVADTEAIKDVEYAKQYLSDWGMEDGPLKTFLTWLLVAGDDWADFLGITAIVEHFQASLTKETVPTESTVDLFFLISSAISEWPHILWGTGKEFHEISLARSKAEIAIIQTIISNRASKDFFEAEKKVLQLVQEKKSLENLKNNLSN